MPSSPGISSFSIPGNNLTEEAKNRGKLSPWTSLVKVRLRSQSFPHSAFSPMPYSFLLFACFLSLLISPTPQLPKHCAFPLAPSKPPLAPSCKPPVLSLAIHQSHLLTLHTSSVSCLPTNCIHVFGGGIEVPRVSKVPQVILTCNQGQELPWGKKLRENHCSKLKTAQTVLLTTSKEKAYFHREQIWS